MSALEFLLIINLCVTLLVAILVLTRKNPARHGGEWKVDFTVFGNELNKVGPLIRDELSRSREENQRTSRDGREELAKSLATLEKTNEEKFEKLILGNAASLKEFKEELTTSLRTQSDVAAQAAKDSRAELTESLKTFGDTFSQNIKDFNDLLRQKFADLASKQEQLKADTENKLEKIRETLEMQLEKGRQATEANLNKIREIVELKLEKNREAMEGNLGRIRESVEVKLEKSRETLESNLDKIRETVEGKLSTLQEENSKKLEEMRNTVEEKLQSSVEKRFNESFRLISERLDQVHKGLGEMQTLATGVGDLKKVLTNVKTRGNLGEVQLGAILEEIFSTDQYEQNVAVKTGSQERVEFAIKLPGRNTDNIPLLLPIDSKFPVEDYQRLIDAYENLANLDGRTFDGIAKQFENGVRRCAKDIKDKYINPPVTTDFAILFVPTEGLYAEILRRPGLFDAIRREYRVTIVGPTNLVAFLSSLQMGFRTLAIEKRSSEVWAILGAVKSEFSLFGVVLASTKKKLEQAAKTIDDAGIRTRAIERHLRKVEELPKEKAEELIGKTLEMEAEDIRNEEKESGVE